MIVYLKVIGIEVHIMAWVMMYDCRPGPHSGTDPAINDFLRQSSAGRVGAEKLTRAQVVTNFVCPSTSPVWKALVDACNLFDPELESSNWSLLWHFGGGSSQRLLSMIWVCGLPMAAKVWWKLGLKLEDWPLILLQLLSPHREEQEAIANRFGGQRVANGVWDLHWLNCIITCQTLVIVSLQSSMRL